MALADYVNSKPVIETKRLTLRPMTVNDVPSLEKWLPDESIYTYWGKGPSKAEKDPRMLFEKKERATKSFHLGIATRETNQIIGDIYVYLIENDRMASLAIRIAKQHQGKGYGTESLRAMTRFCFEKTELQRLWAEADVRNIPSWKMLEKSGYLREGLIRQGKMVNSWCDYYLYGILKSDVSEPKEKDSAF
ncbi:MAG: GNAT family N-acetyltransferase [Erysipelotrichaceae bacterium]|nr:GNAT family N-acetyltransferase [Erysipelotrichaceae bacterium]